MAIATLTALGIGLGAAGSLGGSLGGSALSASGASSAAGAQAQAAMYAADLQYRAQLRAQKIAKRRWQQNLQLMAPWWSAGAGALSPLSYLMGITPQQFPFGPPSQGQAGAAGATIPLSGMADGSFAYTGDQIPTYGPGAGLRGPQSPEEIRAYWDEIQRRRQGLPPSGAPQGVDPDWWAAFQQRLAGEPTQAQLPPAPASAGGGPPSQAPDDYGGLPFGYLTQPWEREFVPPTVTDDPGYQFRLQQGQEALERSAAARGGLLTGATARAIEDYSQGLASQEYGAAYGRTLTEYQQAYNIFKQNQTDIYNRLAAMSGMGQTTAGQLSSAGLQNANAMANILMGGAQNIGQAYQNAAAARASGYVGAGNAWGQGLAGGLGSLGQLLMYQQLMGGGGNQGNQAGANMLMPYLIPGSL